MNSTTLSFENLHNHGALFENVLRARRDSFEIRNRWDVPQTDGMEYDQYDTPQSRWLAVHDETGRVLAGARMTPTTARCGIYSYKMRDAQNGLISSIPTNVLYDEAPVEESTWEVTRGFVAHDLPGDIRQRVRIQLVKQLLRTSREEGITKMLALMPANWDRWAGRCMLDMKKAGPEITMGGMDYQAAWIDFAAQLN